MGKAPGLKKPLPDLATARVSLSIVGSKFAEFFLLVIDVARWQPEGVGQLSPLKKGVMKVVQGLGSKVV
jgi:hypothetical protein